MKTILLGFLVFYFFPLVAQDTTNNVITTRITHLLEERDQSTFDHNVTIPPGTTVFVLEYYPDGYYSVRYNSREYFIYYPYFSDVANIAGIRARVAVEEESELWMSKQRQPSKTPASRPIYTGPRGGKYYINSNGKKTYIKK